MIAARLRRGSIFPSSNPATAKLLAFVDSIFRLADQRYAVNGDVYPTEDCERKVVEREILDQLDYSWGPILKLVYHDHDVLSVDGIIYPNAKFPHGAAIWVTGFAGHSVDEQAIIQESVWSGMKKCYYDHHVTPVLLYWFGKPESDGSRYFFDVYLSDIGPHPHCWPVGGENKTRFTLPDDIARRHTYTSTQTF